MDKISCFTHGTVVCDLESTDKFLAIHELINEAPVFRDVDGIEHLERAVVQREKIQSTGLGHGVAVAHGKSPAVGDIVMALGISRKGIDFDAIDGAPVHFLFLVANPPGMQLEYLLALSVLVRVIRDENFREELLNCYDSAEIERRLFRAFRASMVRRGFPVN
ncbi:MAG: PTS sugar transporter subunit IIA [Spirochaetales bacterium]|nr:PTS sugar transporter subunit IIA [Spirochaetales bacterium]